MRRVTPSMLTLLITLIFIAFIGSGFSINPTNSFSFFTDLHGLIQPTLDLSTLNRSVTVDEPVIATDKVRYLAGENVGIGGSGFVPGTRIRIRIVPTDVVLGINENPEEIVVVVDDNGQFEASWPLESDALGFLFSAQAEEAAPVYFGRIADLYTDKYDYNTGETALITGDGFNPNEQVTLQVVHSNGQNGGAGHLPFTTNADADGRISTTWYVNPDDSHDEIFRIRAVGSESGIETYSTITDPPIIVVDDGGPDDNPGQKDLTFIQVDDPMMGIQSVVWGWDDTRWTGNNTGDACVLYDNDGDGFANFALCVTISQTITSPPPTFQLYSCGNTRTDRCDQPATPLPTQNSTGSANIGLNVDPFRTNPAHTTGNTCDQRPACYNDDTLANVSVNLADVAGPGATRLTNVCSYPSGQPNSDPSDCILNPNNGRLTIVKVATPNDPVNFVFNASAPSQGNVSQWTIPGSGSVQQISYAAGNTLDLNEVVPSGWSLAGASCVINNGTTNPPTGTPTATGVDNITIQASIETVCTFNNQLATGTVTLIKQVAGGTPPSTFAFATTGLGVVGNATINTNGGSAQVVFNNVPAGTKTINENTTPTGWTFVSVQCVSNGPTPTYNGPLATFTLTGGGSVTCTFLNAYAPPQLTLTKNVINDNGGTAHASAWTLAATGSSGSFSGSGAPPTGTTASLTSPVVAGVQYTLSESGGPTGYSSTGIWSCTGGGQFVSPNLITLADGESANCAITNNDIAPQLTVIKHVVNDNGGTATAANFTMEPHDDGADPATFPGAEAPGTTISIDPGAYSVTESGPSGYTASFSADCTGTIAVGESKTCTITNDDQPANLIIIKSVVNDNGGNAVAGNFNGNITGTAVFSGGNTWTGTVAPGQNKLATALGSYNVVENAFPGYAVSYSADCNSTIALGQTKTCTVTNDDIAPTLTLTKVVTNNNGGTAGPNAFGISVAGNVVVSGASNAYNANTPLAINEAGLAGYSFVSITGHAKCPAVLGGTVTLDEGENVSCTITNDDQPANLIIIKNVVNDNGGNAVAGNFNGNITGTAVFSGGNTWTGTVAPGQNKLATALGSYNVVENAFPGYAVSYSADCNSTIALGQTKTCTVTNDDIAPTLTLTKVVTNNNGGTAGPNAFGISVAGNVVLSGVSNPYNANTPLAINEAGLAGYSFVSITGHAKCPAVLGGTVTLDEGENVSCTITNDDQQAFITVVKSVINNSGGTAQPNDFLLTLEGVPVSSGVQVPVNPGTYTAAETQLLGYTFEGFSGQCDSNGDVTVALGQSKTCTLTNNDQQAFITVVKAVTNDNGGSAQPNDFLLTLEGAPVSSGVQVPVNPGTYTAGETQLSGYTFEGFTGQCDANGDVTVALGESKTCTLTNNDQQAFITVVKVVVNNNGGMAQPNDFALTLAGNPVSSGVPVPVNPGTHTAGETLVPGYSFQGFSGNCNSQGQVTVALGQSRTCTLTNDDLPGTLIVRKIVLSPNVTDTPDDFSYTINNGSSIQFEADGENSHVVNTGSYTVVENPANGFVTTYDNCTNVLIPLGGQQICTITNVYITGFVTSSSLCTFDVAPDKDGSQFRLLFTPDGSVSVNKLNASNPGQYYYNVLHFNPPGEGPEDTVTMNIPFPFVTHGATPVHIYSSVTTRVDNGQVCLAPGTDVGNQQDEITLESYLAVNPNPVLGVTQTSVTVEVPDGFSYVNIHLDYGLKRTTGYVKSVVGTMNNADQTNNAPLLPDIPDMQNYTFSNGGVHVVQSINNFKKNPGVGGLFRTLDEVAIPGQTVRLFNSSGVMVAPQGLSDDDGWYFVNYKHTGREAVFTVLWVETGVTKQFRLKSNGMGQVDFP